MHDKVVDKFKQSSHYYQVNNIQGHSGLILNIKKIIFKQLKS